VQKYNAVLVLTALACASGAFAQSTSTTMDMGGGMTHVDTMGPNGAMSSSNCMNMGGGIATCNTMDMSQPQRNNPTPDMSRPQRSYATPEVNEREPSYAPPYLNRLPAPVPAAPPTLLVGRADAAPSPVVAGTTNAATLLTPAPMSLVSARFISIPDWAKSGSRKATSDDEERNDTLYTVSYLGHTFAIGGPKGLSIENIRSRFDQAWNDDPWEEYTSSGSGTIYYYNIRSERVYSDRIEIWVKGDHSKDRTRKARTSKILYEVKCDGQIIRDLLSFTYDANGNVLSSFESPGTAQRVIPETIGSALHEEMCRIKP
jgi:hypothetical protein